MRLFICYRRVDESEGKKIIDNLLSKSENALAVLTHIEHSSNWKKSVEEKMSESDFVAFLLGNNTFESQQLIWEYAKAKELNKRIIGIKLKNASEDSILYCQGFQVFDNISHTINYLIKSFEQDRILKLEQYKFMVAATEQVTDQRLKVHNLFFTITSSILSVTFVLGKTFGITLLSFVVVIIMTLLALFTTFFWEKLVMSYGKLNKGKFKMIDKIEKGLRTNLFEEEWKVLLSPDVKYESNTITEKKIIKRFRLFITVLLILEIGFLIYKFDKLCIC